MKGRELADAVIDENGVASIYGPDGSLRVQMPGADYVEMRAAYDDRVIYRGPVGNLRPVPDGEWFARYVRTKRAAAK